MFLAPKQNYSDAFIVKKLNFKYVIFSVQKHLILEILFLFFSKSMVKPFYHDLKGKIKSHKTHGQLAVSLRMPDTRADFMTNARTL